MRPKIVFFVDFDNTLIDNDKVKKQVKKIIIKTYGLKFTNRFLAINQKIREEKGFVDFPSTIRQIVKESQNLHLRKNFMLFSIILTLKVAYLKKPSTLFSIYNNLGKWLS